MFQLQSFRCKTCEHMKLRLNFILYFPFPNNLETNNNRGFKCEIGLSTKEVYVFSKDKSSV